MRKLRVYIKAFVSVLFGIPNTHALNSPTLVLMQCAGPPKDSIALLLQNLLY